MIQIVLVTYGKRIDYVASLLSQQNEFSVSIRIIDPTLEITDKIFIITKTDDEDRIFETIVSNK